jgi:c-di-GMP-binding flagellar brake protein YcgR
MNSVLRKILFLAATLNVTALALAFEGENPYDTMSQSIDRAMSKYFSGGIVLLLIAVMILLIIAVVFYEVQRSNKIKKALVAVAMAKFDFQAEKLNLRLSNVAILKKIAQKSELQDPSLIMKFSHVFENELEKYYESEKIESISNEILVKISALRKELGFSPLPRGIALTSTRQFCSGDKCMAPTPESNPQTLKGVCYVIDSGERNWSITRPAGPQMQAGTWVRMSLTRQGDAEYTFRTQVLKDLINQGELVLCHTNKLDRTQQRNWLRIDVNIPIDVTLMEETHVGDIFSGKILDISGGGLRMALPTRLQSNSMVLLNFELPGHGQIIDLLVNVVRVVGPLDGSSLKIVHSVAFANTINSGHEILMKYIFEKQRENLSIRQS